MRKILLDTNAYSQFMAGNENVLEKISESDVVYISIFVLAELLYGFKCGSKIEKNTKELKIFCQKPIVQMLNATSETSEVFSDIKLQLKKRGRPIPYNDMWIAAHTMETGSILITNDSHFDEIEGIRKFNF